MKKQITRRELLKTTVVVGAFPVIALGTSHSLANSSQLDPENAQAKALEYSHKSSMADRVCGNCKLYTGDASKEWGPCTIFPGQNVASAGWCKA